MARIRARKARRELKNTAYEIFIGVLSILSIANIVLVYWFADEPSVQLVLSVMNALLSVIFLGDFIYRLATAESASHYFLRGFGWADLFASLPFPQLKILRVFRLTRVASLMREVGPRALLRTLIRDRANSTLLTLLLLGVLVLEFGSMTILAVEGDAEGANITSASDALWYTIVTISTVGYGDQFPVTNIGRLVGGLLIIVGVGIFGTFTGYLANVFLGPQKHAPADDVADTEETAGASAAEAPAEGASTTLEVDGPAPAAAGRDLDADTAARLQALLAKSEQTMAEIRELLGTQGR